MPKDELDYTSGAPDEGTTDDVPDDKTAPTGTTDEGTDEDNGEDEDVDPALVAIQKQLNDTKAAYAKSQTALHQIEGRLAESRTTTTTDQVDDVLDGIEDDDIVANPAIVKKLLRQVRDDMYTEFVAVIKERDKMYDEKFRDVDPEVFVLKDSIAQLEKDPDYTGFSKSQLAVIAKKTRDAEVVAANPSADRGSPGGGRRVKTKKSPEDIRKSPLFLDIYGDDPVIKES